MSSLVKGNFMIECKDNLTYSLMLYKFTKRFNSVFSGVPYVKDAQEWQLERRGKAFGSVDFRQMLNNLLHKFEKEYTTPIKEGRMVLDFQNTDSGGNILIKCEGTQEELDDWFKISLRDKATMLLVRKWIAVKVERF